MPFQFIKNITQAVLKNNDQKDLIELNNGQIISIGTNGLSLFDSKEHHDKYTTEISCRKDPIFVKFNKSGS